jgi:hypothetical protein
MIVVDDSFRLDRNAINSSQGQILNLSFTSSRAGPVRILIYNSAGELAHRLLDITLASPRAWSGTWDGRNSSGNLLSSGVYLIHFSGPVQSQTRRVAILR